MKNFLSSSLLAAALALPAFAARAAGLGAFEGQSDVGSPAESGSATCDGGYGYVLTGAGANVWGTHDQFHYVWRRLAGDFSIEATVRFPKPGEAPDRKAGLMVRASLAADAPYVDAVVHGAGLTALQYRDAAGAPSHSIRFAPRTTVRLRLVRTKSWFTMWAAPEGEPLQELGSYQLKLAGPVYVGLMVCSHRAHFVDTADFAGVVVRRLGPAQEGQLAAAYGPLPLHGLAQVTVDVRDLDAARRFYAQVLGYEEAFDLHDGAGQVTAAFFKVNDGQFIELQPGRTGWQSIWRFALRTDDIERLRSMLVDRGFNPTPIARRADGNLSFRIPHPPGEQMGYVEFLQYEPDSMSARTAGQFLGPRRLSTHLEHLGIITTDYDAAYRFYKDGLGFKDRYLRYNHEQTKVVLDQLDIPGPKLEFVELFNDAGSPLPVTHKVARGAVHFALTVPDDMAVYRETFARGIGGHRPPPRYAWDNRYNTNIYDPDGTRVEFMQPEDPQRPTPLVVYTPQPPPRRTSP